MGSDYYDLSGSEAFEAVGDRVELLRIEQLYPLPEAELVEAIRRYPRAREMVWVQEEPANMGGWSYMRPELERLAGGRSVHYAGREAGASTAEGYAEVHAERQAAIVEKALSVDS